MFICINKNCSSKLLCRNIDGNFEIFKYSKYKYNMDVSRMSFIVFEVVKLKRRRKTTIAFNFCTSDNFKVHQI